MKTTSISGWVGRAEVKDKRGKRSYLSVVSKAMHVFPSHDEGHTGRSAVGMADQDVLAIVSRSGFRVDWVSTTNQRGMFLQAEFGTSAPRPLDVRAVGAYDSVAATG